MKKCLVCLLAVLMLAGCAVSEEPLQTTEAAQSVQLANPWVSYDTLTEAEEAAGFSFSMNEEIESFRAESFRVMNGQLLEVSYRDADFRVTVRMQPGQWQDLSGVYESYTKEIVYEAGGAEFISRAFTDTGASLDLISADGYSWSVYAPDGYPENYRQGFLNAMITGTPAWIREANEACCSSVWENGNTRASEISCFFTSTWSSPEEIDLAAFLRYCPLGEQLLDEHSEEAQAVIAAAGENVFAVTPVWRYPKEAVSSLLRKYSGITVEDLLSRENVLYLEEYDAFYNFTSDWGPGRFTCTGGEQSGNLITLWGEGTGGTARTLTLREEKGEYFLVSFLDSGE